MQLAAYLNEAGIQYPEFADQVGTTPSHISNIVTGKKIPSKALMDKIFKATNGLVKPGDFYPEITGEERIAYANSRARVS